MKLFLLGFTALLTLSACTPRLAPTTNTAYVDRNLTRAQVLSGGISVMPILISAKQFRNVNARYPEVMPRLSQRLGDVASETFPSIKLVSSDDVGRLVGTNNKTVAYVGGYFDSTQFFDDNGVLRPELVEGVLNLSETRFALFAYLRDAGITSSETEAQSVVIYTTLLWDNTSKKTVFISTDSGDAKADPKVGVDERTLQASLGAFRGGLKKLEVNLK